MERPATVVRVIARLNVGGPAIHTILLNSRLPAERYRSILVKGSEAPGEGDLMALAEERRVSPVLIPQMGRELRPFDDLVALLKLTRIIWSSRPAIVHTHTSKAGTLGRLAVVFVNLARGAKGLLSREAARPIRSVHTYHGHIFHGYFSPLKARLFLAIERLLARSTDVVVAISPRQKSEIVQTYRIAPSERVRTIPLGLELAPFLGCRNRRGKLRAELGLDDDTPLIGIVGRLVPIKRHDLLFKALSQLKSSLSGPSGFCCVVVGDGELGPSLRKQVEEMGLSDSVRFLGWRRDLEIIYSDLDCVVLTSDNEGTPVSVIEALASQVPVIATAVGGVPDLLRPLDGEPPAREVTLSNGERLGLWRGEGGDGAIRGPCLGEGGVLLPPGDAEALALALELLWSSPGVLAECGRRGSAWVHKAYTVERLVADIDSLYQGLLGQGAVDLGEEA